MTTGTAHSHSVSIPVSQMALCPPAALADIRRDPPEAVVATTPRSAPAATTNGSQSRGYREQRRSAVATEKLRPSGSGLSQPGPNFDGLHVSDLLGDDCSIDDFASDDSGAVGFDHYVQVVNTAMAIYDKSGNLVAGPISGETFWHDQPDCGGTQNWSDAVVRFDRYANRWVISRPGAGRNGNDLCMAVSKTSDPTGQYDQYAFEVNNTENHLEKFFNDYPKIAVFSDAYYATADPNKIFSGLGNTISAFERDSMLAGNPTPEFVTFFVPAPQTPFTHSHMLAADLEGTTLPPGGSPEYIVQVQDDTLGFPADRLQVYEFHPNWIDPLSSTLVPTDSLSPDPFNCNACADQFCIEQPGIPTLLDSLSYGYMMQRLTYRNFGDHQMLLLNHTVAADGDPTHNHAGIRWYELRMGASGPWEIYQQGTYVPDANDRWLGSIAMDKNGNIALGFHVSGAEEFPSLHYAGRQPGDPLGTLPQGEVTLMEGNGAQLNTSFFGDYSQMTVDPTDDCTFWYTGTYYRETGDATHWRTRIGAFRFGDCIPSPRPRPTPFPRPTPH
jgi:hypothetical protein